MSKLKNVYVTGSIAYDTIMDFPNSFQDYFHPEKLHQINVSFVVDKLEKQLGGTGTNISYNIGRANVSTLKRFNVNLLGAVGKDGENFIKFFEENNIDASGVLVDQRLYTSAGSVITDIKDNQIWGFYYGAAVNIPKINFEKINKETDLFIISANHRNSFLYFQKEVIKNKISYLYDPGMALTWITDRQLREGVMNAKYLIGNDYEIGMILKRVNLSINQLINAGIKIITTLGEKGVEYVQKFESSKVQKLKSINLSTLEPSNLKTITIPTFKVKAVIDPTGAGDAWRGGFVAGLLMDYETRDCLKLGNVMASFAIEKYGTVNHKPNLKEIKRRMNQI